MNAPRIAVFLFALAIGGCAGLPKPPPPSAEVGVDGVACVGTVPAAYPNLSPATDAALLAKAQYPSGKGGECAARVFSAAAPVQVYRVYDSTQAGSMYGGWWALTRPQGPRDAYRAKNAICQAWSNLDRLVACRVKPGSEVVLGTTQSVDCSDGSVYPKTAEVQVYMPNNQGAGVLYVEDCHEEGAWP